VDLGAKFSRRFWGSEAPDPVIDPWQVSAADLTPEERFLRLEAAHRTTLRERARIIRLQRSQFWAVVVFGVTACIVAFMFGSNLQHAIDGGHSAQIDLRAYQIASCERGNTVRAENNRSHADDYAFDTTLAAALKVSLAEPEAVNPNLTQRQRAANRAVVAEFVGQLESAAADKEWTHLIEDCEYAVDHPTAYHFPPPVKFSQQLPPPAALQANQ
jgi:hypothetical protein